MKQLPYIMVSVVLALLTACEAGPDYNRPPVVTPVSYKEAYGEWRQADPQDMFDRGAWWKIYKDSVLDDLERQVDISNQNLKAAEAAWREANAITEESRAALYPSVTADASVGNMHGTTPRPMLPDSVFAGAAWEPDVWGRIRRGIESAQAHAEASAADLASARLSLQAALATNYFDLRAQDELEHLLNAQVETRRTELRIIRHQYDTGTGEEGDVFAARMQLENAEARAANAKVRRAKIEHVIAVLIGKPPAAFSLKPQRFADYVPEIPAGLPSALLERRPDIASAERQMAAANAQIGVATAAWFPDLSLSASIGYDSMSISKLFTASSEFWAVGPQLAETVFDAGARETHIRQKRAAYDERVAMYRQTVLTAFQQVEDNLAALRILAQQRKAQEAAVAHARMSEHLLLSQYSDGISPIAAYLSAQIARLANEQTLLEVRRSRLDASVELVQDLGGGWNALKMGSMEMKQE